MPGCAGSRLSHYGWKIPCIHGQPVAYSLPARETGAMVRNIWSVTIAALIGFALGYFPQFRFFAGLAFLAVVPLAIVFTSGFLMSDRFQRLLGRVMET